MTGVLSSIEVIRVPGLVSYEEGQTLQMTRHKEVAAGEKPGALFLLEHTPVITLGRNAHADNILASKEDLARMGIAVYPAGRGGDVTYHGPGQLVAYPVINLRLQRQSLKWYLRSLEEVIIRTLAHFGLEGERVEGLTGVWVRGGKAAAIGVGVRDWVTFHGFALNVNPDMRHFSAIIPCGIGDRPVTSLALLLGEPPTMEETAQHLAGEFRSLFG